jgi:hypothetical protein
MGELLDKLSASETGAEASNKSALDQAADLFGAASQKVNEAIKATREPGMPLDSVSRWTRQMPLQALAVAFLLGVMTVRRRRP